MSLKSYIVPRIAAKLLSQNHLDKQRQKFERQRIKLGEDHVIEFFHDPADPYSQLLEKALPHLSQTYSVRLITHKTVRIYSQ